MKTMSMSQANVAEAEAAHILAAWSNLVTLDRPEGLSECFLVEGDGLIQVIGVWDSIGAHDAALADEKSHPGYVVFESAGVECTHTLMSVVGSIRR